MIFLTTELSHTAENFLQLLGVSILFIFVLIATYLTTKFVGNVKLGQYKNSNFKVLETYKITQNKYLQLIQIGKRYFVISVGKDIINFITELNETDIEFTEMGRKQVNFTDIIAKLTNKQNENEHK
jgi:flagellar protein FliO/FliZ